MRTILRSSLLEECYRDSSDELVLVSYRDRFLRRDGQFHTPKVDVQTAEPHTLKSLRDYNRICTVFFFTEETPEELQAKLEAMSPSQKMAHVLSKCEPRQNLFDPQNINNLKAADFKELMSNKPVHQLSSQALAYLLACDANVRVMMDSAHVRQFDELINQCRAKVTQAVTPSPLSRKISLAFAEMGGGF